MATGLLFGRSAPAAGKLDAEVFTAEVRATAAGWLTGAQVVGSVAGLFAFGLIVG